VRLTEAEAEAERARATATFIGDGLGASLTLRSPISGVVLAVKATPGATVAPGGEGLVEVGDPESLWVVADVPERELSLVAEGSHGTFESASLPGTVTGRVISVGAALSNGLRTAPVRIALDARPAGMRPGMFGWVLLDGAGGGPTLPVDAVLIKDGRTSVVYVAKDDRTFERREVVVGRAIGGRVPVVSGLAPGERVVVRGALLLDGSAEQLL
jgi:cobalt-zinc-cadmium efflux system membrane fusion protein